MELTALIDLELEQNPVLEYSELEESEEEQDWDTIEETEELELIPEQDLSIEDGDFEILKRLDQDFRDHFESDSVPRQRTSEDDQLQTFLESSITDCPTLFEKLMAQARDTFDTDLDLKVAEAIIGNFDQNGYLTVLLDEIAIMNGWDIALVARILAEIQLFDPAGIGARNLQESLLLQLRRLNQGESLGYRVVLEHFDDLVHNRIPVIQKKLKVSMEGLRHAIDDQIAKLDLHPGASFERQSVQHIVPDVVVHAEGNTLVVEVNGDGFPALRLNRRYMRMLEDETVSAEIKDYIKHKILSGKWLMRNLRQRNDTLDRIAKSLVKRQERFFLGADGQLLPLTMKIVAEELELHESTIARAVANKYLHCARGVISLRTFFSNGYVTEKGEDISSSAVKEVLLQIIAEENKAKPLSDEEISAKMKEMGINCARRTVSKYRALSNIGSTTQRRCYGLTSRMEQQ